MNHVYEITAINEFSSAHLIEGIEGPCSRLHGHNWKIEVTILCKKLDQIGFSVDFYWLENLIKEQIITPLDHRYINELEHFHGINPTCENIAKWCFNRLKDKICSLEYTSLQRVALWENNKFKITVTEDKA